MEETIRQKLIKSINKTVDELQILGADEIADAILSDIPEINKADYHRLDLADAQFIGFKNGKWESCVISLVECMGLTKDEFNTWLKEYAHILDDSDLELIKEYFNK